MMTHDATTKKETTIFTMEDNVLIEWLCALRLVHLKRIHVMPLFLGNCEDTNNVGGSFFERDAVTGTIVLERLPDEEAKPSVAKAVELMTKAGVWTSGTIVAPSAFGLSSLSVRAIVTAMTSQMGIKACDSKNPTELLRSCATEITAILAKGGGAAAGGAGGESLTPAVPSTILTTPASPVAATTSSSPFDAAWSVLQGASIRIDIVRICRHPFFTLSTFLTNSPSSTFFSITHCIFLGCLIVVPCPALPCVG